MTAMGGKRTLNGSAMGRLLTLGERFAIAK